MAVFWRRHAGTFTIGTYCPLLLPGTSGCQRGPIFLISKKIIFFNVPAGWRSLGPPPDSSRPVGCSPRQGVPLQEGSVLLRVFHPGSHWRGTGTRPSRPPVPRSSPRVRMASAWGDLSCQVKTPIPGRRGTRPAAGVRDRPTPAT